MGPGLSESEARAQALSEFGNRTLHLDDSRAVWRWAWLDSAVDTGNPPRFLRCPGLASPLSARVPLPVNSSAIA